MSIRLIATKIGMSYKLMETETVINVARRLMMDKENNPDHEAELVVKWTKPAKEKDVCPSRTQDGCDGKCRLEDCKDKNCIMEDPDVVTKRFFFNVVEYGVLNPAYQQWRMGRIEVHEKGEHYAIGEGFMKAPAEIFNAVRDAIDFKECDETVVINIDVEKMLEVRDEKGQTNSPAEAEGELQEDATPEKANP